MIFEFKTRRFGVVSFYAPDDVQGRTNIYLGTDATGRKICEGGKLTGDEIRVSIKNAEKAVVAWHRKRINSLFMGTGTYA